MGSRRFILASLSAVLLLATAGDPTLAKKPDPGGTEERPLTPQEQAASDRKAAAAERYVESVRASGGDLVSLSCYPMGAESLDGPAHSTMPGGGQATEDSAVTGAAGFDGSVEAPERMDATITASCGGTTQQGFLAVEARDQINGFYCGPAVGQVIANYAWAMAAGTNKYLQRQIAQWMATDTNGGTSSWWMQEGLDVVTRGSPRQPKNWDWIVTWLHDSDGDGWVGDQLDAYVRSNISYSKMPLAISVKPHDPNSPSGAYLWSWPNPVWSVGHWVAIYGWVYIHDGSDRARMYFTDSSRDEGGGTGKYWTPTRWFTLMILEHTRYIVW